MKLAGNAELQAPVERVWAALRDPDVLVRTIPGCQTLEETGTDEYRMTVTAGVASIKGTYLGQVRLSDFAEPTSFRMSASGSGTPGTVSAEVQVTLAPSETGTTVQYAADAVVGGMIGGVGQRVLAAVAKKTAGEFFTAVDRDLSGATDRVAAPVAAAGPVSPSPADRAAPGVTPRLTPDGTGFVRGAVFGASVALLGVLVGAAVRARS